MLSGPVMMAMRSWPSEIKCCVAWNAPFQSAEPIDGASEAGAP